MKQNIHSSFLDLQRNNLISIKHTIYQLDIEDILIEYWRLLNNGNLTCTIGVYNNDYKLKILSSNDY